MKLQLSVSSPSLVMCKLIGGWSPMNHSPGASTRGFTGQRGGAVILCHCVSLLPQCHPVRQIQNFWGLRTKTTRPEEHLQQLKFECIWKVPPNQNRRAESSSWRSCLDELGRKSSSPILQHHHCLHSDTEAYCIHDGEVWQIAQMHLYTIFPCKQGSMQDIWPMTDSPWKWSPAHCVQSAQQAFHVIPWHRSCMDTKGLAASAVWAERTRLDDGHCVAFQSLNPALFASCLPSAICLMSHPKWINPATSSWNTTSWHE